jgi:hypothetical protein
MTPFARLRCAQFFVGCEVSWERPKSKSASGSQALTLVGVRQLSKSFRASFTES